MKIGHMPDLVSQMLSGDRLALSRLISQVEGRSKDLVSILSKVQARCGKAYTVGVTGPPGAGKSTLVDRLIAHLRRSGKGVGVIAIDPSSPFSGGAVLGDRIRMQEHSGDDGVFIRSLGSRGSHGGLSRATREVVKLYDAFGMDTVLVETVGVGQTELDIMEIADTTIVIVTPESGDSIQTLKAGILEIADIFVVNKADRDGSHLMQAELRAMLELGGRVTDGVRSGGERGSPPDFEPASGLAGAGGWSPPVLLVQANKDQGVAELLKSIESHTDFLRGKGRHSADFKKKKIASEEVREIVLDGLKTRLNGLFKPSVSTKNPYEAAQKILKSIPENLWQPSDRKTRRRPKPSRRSCPARKRTLKRR